MFKILVVEHIHPAGEALLAQKAQLVFPSRRTRLGFWK